jgi:hypothetical protein
LLLNVLSVQIQIIQLEVLCHQMVPPAPQLEVLCRQIPSCVAGVSI